MMRLLAVLLIVLLSLETVLYARSNLITVAARREVKMNERTHGSGGQNSQRSPIFYPVQAFIDGSNLQLQFYELPSAVEVNIVNTQTNEVYYSGTYVSTDNVVISLDGLNRGEYRLEISLDANTTMFYGDFIF